MAKEYKNDFIITLVLNMNDVLDFKIIENPVKNLIFTERTIHSREIKEYHLAKDIC